MWNSARSSGNPPPPNCSLPAQSSDRLRPITTFCCQDASPHHTHLHTFLPASPSLHPHPKDEGPSPGEPPPTGQPAPPDLRSPLEGSPAGPGDPGPVSAPSETALQKGQAEAPGFTPLQSQGPNPAPNQASTTPHLASASPTAGAVGWAPRAAGDTPSRQPSSLTHTRRPESPTGSRSFQQDRSDASEARHPGRCSFPARRKRAPRRRHVRPPRPRPRPPPPQGWNPTPPSPPGYREKAAPSRAGEPHSARPPPPPAPHALRPRSGFRQGAGPGATRGAPARLPAGPGP